MGGSNGAKGCKKIGAFGQQPPHRQDPEQGRMAHTNDTLLTMHMVHTVFVKQAAIALGLIDNLNKFVIGARAWAVPEPRIV